MNISKVFRFFLLINFFSINNAHAYLDPGSASIIFQFFALLLGSLIIFIGRINNLINSILSKKKNQYIDNIKFNFVSNLDF